MYKLYPKIFVQRPSCINKLLLIMKLTTLFLIMAIMQVNAIALAQKVTLSEKNTPIKKVLDKIRAQTNYDFVFSDDVLKDINTVTVNVKNADLSTALNVIFYDKPLEYSIEDNAVVISKKTVFFPSNRVAQLQSVVNGKVVDEQGRPLPGASVKVIELNRSLTTNPEGQFSVNVESGTYTFEVNFIGYVKQSRQVKVTGSQRLDLTFSMIEAKDALNEVLVVGYGKSTKRSLTNSVSRLDAANVAQRNVSSANQLMQGQIAGVNLTVSNGTPGGASRVSIRGISSINGDNEPLYVIDGIPLSKDLANYNFSGEYRQDPLSLINPSDIETIDVLKDAAAAAIYGSRATNGVILITTKQGKSGKSRIAVSQLSGIQTMPKKLNLLNPQEYIALQTEATNTFNNDMNYRPGQTGFVDIKTVLGAVPADPYDVNWQELIINTPATSNQTDFSFSGGNEATSHFTSAGYQYQEGLIQKSSLKRYSLRSNIDFKPNSTFNFGLRVAGNFTKSTSIPNGDQGTALFQRNLEQRPYDRPYLADGSFAVGGKDILRHNGVLILAKDHTFDDNYQGLANLYANIKFLKYFTYHSAYNAEIRQGRGFRHQNINHPYNVRGYINDVRNSRYSATIDNTLNFKKTWSNGLDIDLLAGHSFFNNRYDFTQATGTEFPSDDFKSISSATIRTSTGDELEYAIESYFSRMTLSYKDRYFLYGSARRDGSSKFRKDNRYATFPSISGAWAFTNESFFEKPNWLEFGKVRVSWGKNGNQDGIGEYAYLPLASGGHNYNLQTGLSVTALGNTDLKWETATQTDFGLDLTFFKGRLTFMYDYFVKKTEDLLYAVPVYQTSGFTTRIANIGSMENRGHEFTFSSVNIDKKLKWSTNFNISFIRNKVVSLVGNSPITVGGWNAIVPGQPLGTFYGYKQLGIYQNLSEIPTQLQAAGVRPGDIKFEDLDNNNIINSGDLQVIGSSQADFSGGLTNTFKYGGFDLSILNTFSVGNEIAAGWRTGLDHMGASNYGMLKDNYEKRWTGPGTSNTVPRATKGGNNIRNSTYYLEDGSFFRIKNITLGYTLPSNLMKQLGVSQARIFTSVNNLLTITKYSGYDPEASMGLDARSFGIDNLVTPQPRSFMLGLNVNF